ncbi:CehA/McbA family metallohydrolase [Sorangium sp. So ce1036]|uniref:CehA/McbA family metallohydrolase n=1 Tax=Sorangium sp. So ce1036 TaxID=3133328 RepID=UPI003F02D159
MWRGSDPTPRAVARSVSPAAARRRVPRAAMAAVAAAALAMLGRADRSPVVAPAGALDVSREPLPARPPRFVERLDVRVFQRGNLHAHSARSDGDSPAQLVFAWYRDHGYQFLALTDHNSFLDATRSPAVRVQGFLVLPGEEVTMGAAGQPVHVNALCTRRRIGGGTFRTVRDALAWATSAILAQGGVALVNHPNFYWAIGPEDIAAAEGAQLLEIFSGHPHVRSDGDANHTSAEEKWEQALSSGQRIAAVAVDDMHALTGANRHVPQAFPGTGWVEVFAEEASQEAICAALSAGRLYASSGPRLTRIAVEADTFTLWVEPPDVMVEFLDRWGALLASELPTAEAEASGVGHRAAYRLRGAEHYVRARLTAPDGSRAWTQAYWVAR